MERATGSWSCRRHKDIINVVSAALVQRLCGEMPAEQWSVSPGARVVVVGGHSTQHVRQQPAER